MSDQNSSRRDFLKTAALSTAGLMAAKTTTATTAASYENIIGANGRVRVGIVGYSDRCKQALIPAMMKYAKEMNYDIVAVSDIWNRRRDEAVEFIVKERDKGGVKSANGSSATVAKARNNDELYAMKDVDAVIVATADFQHAQHGVEAVRAGRDAYVEKPLANTMEDAKAILKAVNETKKIVQIGTQRRSTKNYMLANDYIRSGKFGDINMVEMSWNVNQPGRWRREKLVRELRQEDTDWNRFVMNRKEAGKKEAFDPRKYLEFRLFWPYSSGIPDQWMVHQIDTVHWFTGLDHPRSVIAHGGIYQWKDGRTNYDTMTAVFDYGPVNDPQKGFQVVYSSRMGNDAGGIKELYFSNGGSLNLDTNKISDLGGLKEKYAAEMGKKANLLPEMSLAEATKVETAANTGVDDSTAAHMRNWMECVRDRKTPNADVRAGYNHSVALCMVIAALNSGRVAHFDEAKQQVVT